jgi:polysaccharide export outer membrane protein
VRAGSGILVFALLIAGCTTYQPTGTPGVWRDQAGNVVDPGTVCVGPVGPRSLPEPGPIPPYTLHVGDTLRVYVGYADGSYDERVTVGPDGNVALPLVENVPLAGLDLQAARGRLAEVFSGLFVEPRLAVSLESYSARTCAVLGQVRNPGRHAVETGLTLVDVIAGAGGFAEAGPDGRWKPDLERAFVSRGGTLLPVDFEGLFRRGELAQNIELRPGDLVYIPGAADRDVIVLGYVHNAGVVPLAQGMSLLGAIGASGGFTGMARLTNVALIRNITRAPLVRIVNVEELLAGREPDLTLQEGDVVFVARDDLLALDVPGLLARTTALVAGVYIAERMASP